MRIINKKNLTKSKSNENSFKLKRNIHKKKMKKNLLEKLNQKAYQRNKFQIIIQERMKTEINDQKESL